LETMIFAAARWTLPLSHLKIWHTKKKTMRWS